MTTLVFAVLALLWGAILFAWLRSRTDGSLSDSISAFRRHLRVLESAAPSYRRPANRPSAPDPGRMAAYRPGRPVNPSRGQSPYGTVSPARRQSERRRRHVFFTLVAAVAGTLVACLIPGLLHEVIYFQLLADLLLAVYTGLLIRMRNLAGEREMKLAYLPSSQPARRRPAEPGYGLADRDVDGYFDGAGYGRAIGYRQLPLRRAAN